MPLHDYRCTECGTRLFDVYRSIAEGARARLPLCPDCQCPMGWIPQVGAMDAKEPFQAYTVARDLYDKNPLTGDTERHQRIERIDSLHTMRKIERDSEQRFRNGEGEPMRFRMLSTDRSNKDVGSFGREGQIGAQHYDSGNPPVQKSGRVSVTRHGVHKPDRAVTRGGGFTALPRPA